MRIFGVCILIYIFLKTVKNCSQQSGGGEDLHEPLLMQFGNIVSGNLTCYKGHTQDVLMWEKMV